MTEGLKHIPHYPIRKTNMNLKNMLMQASVLLVYYAFWLVQTFPNRAWNFQTIFSAGKKRTMETADVYNNAIESKAQTSNSL